MLKAHVVDVRSLTIRARPAAGGMPATENLGDRGMMAEGSPMKVMRDGYALPGVSRRPFLPLHT